MEFRISAGQITLLSLCCVQSPVHHSLLVQQHLVASLLSIRMQFCLEILIVLTSRQNTSRKTSICGRSLVTVCYIKRMSNRILLEEYWQLSIICRILTIK